MLCVMQHRALVHFERLRIAGLSYCYLLLALGSVKSSPSAFKCDLSGKVHS